MYKVDLLDLWYKIYCQLNNPISQVMYWHCLSVYDEVMADIKLYSYRYAGLREGD